MKRFAVIFLVATFLLCLWLPAEGYGAQRNRWRNHGNSRRMVLLNGHRGKRRNGRWFGYKNYGQYRRTQVGNRRFKWNKHNSWKGRHR